MTTHSAHDDILEAGLQSGCLRCEEIVLAPVDLLDNENLVRILSGHVYSDLDREAQVRMSWIATQYERMQEVIGL
jgi:hypothetical protein